jgi:hypothetical protein
VHYTTIFRERTAGRKKPFQPWPLHTRLTRFATLGDNAAMAMADVPLTELPDRLCTWCQVPMKKRLVGGKQFIHYTCPKCIFQHTTRLGPKPAAPKH